MSNELYEMSHVLTHLSLISPSQPMHESYMNASTFLMVGDLSLYSIGSTSELDSALQFALRLGFRSPRYVLKPCAELNRLTMMSERPELPVRLIMIEAFALSSRSGSTPGEKPVSAENVPSNSLEP
jgi:hypothetical protein